jgi:hypothetical protein
VPAAAVVPALDPFEDGSADLLDGAPRLPVEFLDLHRPDRLWHIALSSASPTVPMLPTTPSVASRRVNGERDVLTGPWSE